MPSDSHFQSPYASPNAIPPRTSSHGIVTSGKNNRSSVLRPLSEIDWMSQSKKSKLYHSPSAPLRSPDTPSAMNQQAYPAHMSSPPPDPIKGIGDDLIYGHKTKWTDEKERIVLGPFDYLVGHPGKDIRSQCIAAFNKWLRVPPERLEVITRVVGMLHTASLLYVC